MGQLRLYHGTNRIFDTLDLKYTKKVLDLGKGIYLAEDYDHAVLKATLKLKGVNGLAYVYVYDVDENYLRSNFKIMEFETANKDWLDFNTDNRSRMRGSRQDMIIAPTADGYRQQLFKEYRRLKANAIKSNSPISYAKVSDILRRLDTDSLKRQVCLKTQRAVDYINQCRAPITYELNIINGGVKRTRKVKTK